MLDPVVLGRAGGQGDSPRAWLLHLEGERLPPRVHHHVQITHRPGKAVRVPAQIGLLADAVESVAHQRVPTAQGGELLLVRGPRAGVGRQVVELELGGFLRVLGAEGLFSRWRWSCGHVRGGWGRGMRWVG